MSSLVMRSRTVVFLFCVYQPHSLRIYSGVQYTYMRYVFIYKMLSKASHIHVAVPYLYTIIH